MNHTEALVSMAQILLRVRGQWTTSGAKSSREAVIVYRKNIKEAVEEIWPLMNIGDDTIMADAARELEFRTGAA